MPLDLAMWIGGFSKSIQQGRGKEEMKNEAQSDRREWNRESANMNNIQIFM